MTGEVMVKELREKEYRLKMFHEARETLERRLMDVYICPEGKNLSRLQEMKRQGKPPFIICRGESCKECAAKEECTRGPALRITRDGRESSKSSKNLIAFQRSIETMMLQVNQLSVLNSRQKSFLDSLI